jgi:chorismate mutase
MFKRVAAVRGATILNIDEKDELIKKTSELISVMMQKNCISAKDIIFILLTATKDIRSAFPAEGARHLTLNSVPLICAQEIDVDSSMERCIRVLIQFYTRMNRKRIKSVYLGAAKGLRSDLYPQE